MRSGAEVIIPVHNAFESLSDCLESVSTASPLASVTVVDDASSDGRIAPLLESWVAGAEQRRLLSNRRNLGFVATVNRAMADSDRDVVLLNSDTLVTDGWLEALERCLASAAEIATATPWSNNGEIVSFPQFCQANPLPADPGQFARAARLSRGQNYAELPTAVGFCMAISRRALRSVGFFDEQTFGRGYGEENDFSLRATAAGMRNVLCDDAYVAHVGGQSFGPLGLKPGEESMRRLLDKHPGYLETVSEWIKRDPLKGRRLAMQKVLDSVAD